MGWVCEQIFFCVLSWHKHIYFLSEMRTQNTCRLNNILKEISFSLRSALLSLYDKDKWDCFQYKIPYNTYTIWFFFILGCCLLEIFWHLLVQWFNFMAIFFLYDIQKCPDISIFRKKVIDKDEQRFFENFIQQGWHKNFLIFDFFSINIFQKV